MHYVDGGTLISELTLPGTHDSATYTSKQSDGLGYVKTQTLSFTEQLAIGCRFLDIRGTEVNNTLNLHHGPFFLELTFNDVLHDCKNFLHSNPDETILMSLKEEFISEDNTISYEEAFKNYYNEDPSLWYLKNEIPKLDDVRGKIVLCRRFPLDVGSEPLGIDMSFQDNTSFRYQFRVDPVQTLVCEDNYHPNSIREKMDAVEINIGYAEGNNDSSNLFLTFTSAYIPILDTPKKMANEMNPWLLDRLHKQKGNKGIVICDFMETQLSEKIVSGNF